MLEKFAVDSKTQILDATYISSIGINARECQDNNSLAAEKIDYKDNLKNKSLKKGILKSMSAGVNIIIYIIIYKVIIYIYI